MSLVVNQIRHCRLLPTILWREK